MTPQNLMAASGFTGESPFRRLAALLADIEPGATPIDLSLGEPRHPIPDFVAPILAEEVRDFSRYPPINGSPKFRAAIAAWLNARYDLDGLIDPEQHVIPVSGSREGLFFAAITARDRAVKRPDRPAILLPNPYYQAYAAAAHAIRAEIVFLDADPDKDFLPDPDALDPAVLDRTIAAYVASPVAPQGTVASRALWRRLIELARRHDFMLFADECYSEIYRDAPPPGAIEAAADLDGRLDNLIVFNSLSKRSNLPGLRSGFSAGDGDFLDTLFEVRNLVGPQMPGPTQHASAAAWAEEQHVTANRLAYAAKYDVADAVLGRRFGYRRPAGGFFLWLDTEALGNGENAALTLWKRFGVKVIPGAYLARTGRDGTNPGAQYVRIALVHDAATIREALERFVHVSA